jgi:hypothetical protein
MIKAEVQNESQEVKVTLKGADKDIAKELYAILIEITKTGYCDIVSLALANYSAWVGALNKEAKESKEDAE